MSLSYHFSHDPLWLMEYCFIILGKWDFLEWYVIGDLSYFVKLLKWGMASIALLPSHWHLVICKQFSQMERNRPSFSVKMYFLDEISVPLRYCNKLIEKRWLTNDTSQGQTSAPTESFSVVFFLNENRNWLSILLQPCRSSFTPCVRFFVGKITSSQSC
jgi:hypothetical protein